MSCSSGPNNITNGLVFEYDMNNTQKSWKGRPVTNQFTLPSSASNGFGVQNSTFTRIYSGNYGGYDIQSTDYVWKYTINGSDCPYHGWDIPTTAGQVVTFSFDYFVDSSSTGYPSTNYLANMENAGSGVGGSFSDPTPSIIGVWKRASFSSTATATGNSRCLLYPGACGAQLATSGFILYKNPQVEFDAPGNVASPFVAGTRSNTQALLDLTNNNTLTASSLTYASDNTFSFNGSSNIITMPENSVFNTQTPTVEVWVKTNATTQNGFFFEKGNVNTQYALFQEGANITWRHTTNVASLLAPAASYINTSQYAQIVGTYTAGDRRIYVNGVQVASDTLNYTLPTNSNGCSIGVYGGVNGVRGYYFNGNIASVKVYNRALTASEVNQNFNALRSRYGI